MSQDLFTVRCIRGELTESIHLVHAVVTDSDGSIIAHSGNPRYLTYARSTVKPIQAIAIIEAGAIQQHNLTQSEITVICASHNGEREHVECVTSILNKIGMSTADLYCDIRDNCSGKHAGMLVLSSMLGISASGYQQSQHPVQKRIASTVASMCNADTSQLVTAIDGCGVPVFGMSIQQLAIGFARLGIPPACVHTDRKYACDIVINAIRHSPFLLAGTDRFDTDLIRITSGRIIGKMGAEGVYAFTVPSQGIGAAIKIVDGADRALYPAVVEILHQLKLLGDSELMKLLPYHKPNLINRHGEIVGWIQPECILSLNA